MSSANETIPPPHPEDATFARRLPLTEAGILLFALLLFAYLCLNQLPAATSGSSYVPVEYDTFYHAVRIREFQSTGSIVQFDPKLNAPSGSYISWPWLYDHALALMEQFGRSLGLAPFAVATFLPPVLGALNLVLIYLIGLQLRLSWPALVFVMLGFATNHAMQMTHLVGRYDHHAAELTLFLGSLAIGLAATQRDRCWLWALWGGCLALAMGIHNGLFVLQLPLAALALHSLLRRRPLPRPQVISAILALLIGTLLLLAGSQPFHDGVFSFYHLSWFHLLVSVATCSIALLATTKISTGQLAG